MNKKNLAAVPAYSLYFVFAVIGVMSSTAYFGSAYSNETINGFGLLLMTVLGVTAALVIYFIDRYRTAMALGFYIIIIIDQRIFLQPQLMYVRSIISLSLSNLLMELRRNFLVISISRII